MTDFMSKDNDAAAGKDDSEGVHTFLESFHHFAATANFEKYFGLFHPNGQFLGTDGTENWTMEEFKAWAKPFFTGVECAWEYIPVPERRTVTITNSTEKHHPTYAVFDEVLYCSDLQCHTRGSGTLVYEQNRWFLMLYHISFPIPDKINQFVTTKIIQGKQILQQKHMLSLKEAEAKAAMEQLLLEAGLEDEGEESQEIKSSKKKNKNKNKKT